VRKIYRSDHDKDGDLVGLQGATVPSKALRGLKALVSDALRLGVADLMSGRSFAPSGQILSRISIHCLKQTDERHSWHEPVDVLFVIRDRDGRVYGLVHAVPGFWRVGST
jgi:hypothetical protein